MSRINIDDIINKSGIFINSSLNTQYVVESGNDTNNAQVAQTSDTNNTQVAETGDANNTHVAEADNSNSTQVAETGDITRERSDVLARQNRIEKSEDSNIIPSNFVNLNPAQLEWNVTSLIRRGSNL